MLPLVTDTLPVAELILSLTHCASDRGNGLTIWLPEKGQTVVRLYGPLHSPFALGTLAHELLHVVCYILHHRGLTLTESSEEAYTYLHGFLTNKVFEGLSG